LNSAVFDIDSSFETKALTWADNHFSKFVFTTNADCEGDGFQKFLFMSNQVGQNFPFFSENCPVAGYTTYDFKKHLLFDFKTHHKDFTFEDACWFEAEIWFKFSENSVTIFSPFPDVLFQEILSIAIDNHIENEEIEFISTTNRTAYIKNYLNLQHQIKQGNLYLCNYCISFEAIHENWQPIQAFEKLKQKLPAPFTCFVKHHSSYLLSASPEKYLQQKKNKIFSSPIKGTIARNSSPELDKLAANELYNSEKERNENVMVVDLVRNDLSMIANNVKVEELFGIYPFSTVYQMISTISGELIENPINWEAIFKATFPMGSMTGAPKKNAIYYTDVVENFSREMYSGTVGYVLNSEEALLNVVIRGVQFNKETSKLSIRVGSACTYMAQPEKEWEECLLKAKGVLNAINGKIANL